MKKNATTLKSEKSDNVDKIKTPTKRSTSKKITEDKGSNEVVEQSFIKLPKLPVQKPIKKAKKIDTRTPEEKALAKAANKSSRMYFNAGTQIAIEKYQKALKAGDFSTRDLLYKEEILPAFQKLAENLINIYKFTSLYDSFDDLKNDCVNFLFETLCKFDSERGTNAFSYFNVVAKNWLIIKSKQRAARTKKVVSLDDILLTSNHDSKLIEEQHIVSSAETMMIEQEASGNIIEVLYDLRSKVKVENELLCVNAIITIFENIDDIDLLNKSAILLYMRELSGLNAKQLTTTMQSLKKMFRKMKLEPDFSLFDR